ncbi:D-alanine--D-alanine ligase family protein [Kribbella solani]|uniref:D-alanine--D-alanine ligase n=1 Tax=Kribbella solani TaxID=236067 RepID=A0A841DD63_9ACTN|nr:D-alanine--D-alanine ligase [Kribbella solani]MBB5976994.1 D-alanine-D-alanine ligase [Kribbella solani]MDX2968018.1 D-alanine--D-alanine ligase [Kribbella solani]MDX3002311.1 D-alanine--D-alanine ligase [Kribbella solani]
MSEFSEVQRKPRVAVVFGGRSSEHAISCVTAANVLQVIDRDKYDVVPVGISTSGHWVLESGDPERLSITDGKLPEVDVTALPVLFGANRELVISEPEQVPSTLGQVDVVFPLLHGPWGEDGTIQGLLEMSDIRYVGSGVLASAVGMDKHHMKVVFQGAGLDVTPYVLIRDRDWIRDPEACRTAVDALGYPVFVKPCRGGSSLGISKVNSLAELDDAIVEARAHDPKVIVEAAAKDPREIEVGVLGGLDGGLPEVSVCGEIAISGGGHDFYDFETKYLPEGEEYTALSVPAELPEELAAEVRAKALVAFDAIDGEGLARVDFFVDADGKVIINEINTMPGFTPTSMFPRLWAASGKDYPALVEHLLTLAMTRKTGLR